MQSIKSKFHYEKKTKAGGHKVSPDKEPTLNYTSGVAMESSIRHVVLALLLFSALVISGQVFANSDTAISKVGVQGYDLVAYHAKQAPVKGNGHHVAVHEGVSYLFVSEANQQSFMADPGKYLPAYGGYCAYGVSVGKKFVGDPEVWKIVNGRLYLNLDKDIQATWKQDIPGNIVKANTNWQSIKDVLPKDL